MGSCLASSQHPTKYHHDQINDDQRYRAKLDDRGRREQSMFDAYFEHILGPTLRPRQVILLDNLSAHKCARLRALVAARGCQLWYLPSYSPDFSPIELAFAKVKAELRDVGARTGETEAAVAQALGHISSEEACAFFRHCGFRFRPNLAQWFCS